MPEKKTAARAKRAKKEGKAASTQAGEFVHEEIEHVRKGKHGAKSAKQAIAIGLSKARRAGVKVGAPKKASAETKRKAKQDSAKAGFRQVALAEAIACDKKSPQEGGQQLGEQEGALDPGQEGGNQAVFREQIDCGQEGRQNQGRRRTLTRSKEGSRDPEAVQLSGTELNQGPEQPAGIVTQRGAWEGTSLPCWRSCDG